MNMNCEQIFGTPLNLKVRHTTDRQTHIQPPAHIGIRKGGEKEKVRRGKRGEGERNSWEIERWKRLFKLCLLNHDKNKSKSMFMPRKGAKPSKTIHT